MPPPKKAAKKAASKHHEGHDLRRAFEHRGRIDTLRVAIGKKVRGIETLMQLAEQELRGSHFKDAADLLRGAEHLGFAHLASSKADDEAHPNLVRTIEAEFDHKLEKAEEHWEESEALSDIYQKALEGAHEALEGGAYRKALELIRAAEAIAHVHLHEEHA